MKSIGRSSLLLAVWLSALAGYVDALGFLYRGGSFVSFMSGNSTRLAVALGEGNRHAALLLAEIISVFILGSMLGALAGHRAGRNRRAVLLGLCLTLVAVGQAGDS